MKPVRKAIIPAAGLGTRFLPATKTVPKELLPIVDRPIILFVVEEAIRAGIEDIVLISGRGKSAIEDFFDRSYELEDTLAKQGKHELLDRISDIKRMANIISVRQKDPLGLGHAVCCGRSVVGDEPFAVLLGDEIMITPPSETTATGQLIHLAREFNQSTVAVMEVALQDVSKYGIIAADAVSPGVFKVKDVVEKPTPETAPSRLALPGRYVFESDIFNELANTRPGRNGEIQLTDAMVALAKKKGMLASFVQARRYDAGDRLGYIQATVELALEDQELGPATLAMLKEVLHSRGVN